MLVWYYSLILFYCIVSFLNVDTAMWTSCMYICIPSFLDFLTIYITTEYWAGFPVLYNRFFLLIHFIHRISGVLEKEMATHSSVLAWRIPWTEKPGRLQSMGSHRVGHNWSNLVVSLVYICQSQSHSSSPHHSSPLVSIQLFSISVYSWTLITWIVITQGNDQLLYYLSFILL